jgi:catechol 2,3-dioxygenase-like lactoylglutathione lyase family enzyme
METTIITIRSIIPVLLAIGLLQPQLARADDHQAARVSFYFAAHEDDWQLFMNPQAFDDVADARTKAVFIHSTAGDAGLGVGTGGRRFPYYLARENGAEAAIRFMADAGRLPADRAAAPMWINTHRIYRVAYGNTVAYFLRVPDGNPGGTGYPETGAQSLQRLATGQISMLAAVDGSTVYDGWSDLVSTVRAILDYERGDAASVALNLPEPDPQINPNDHSDHLMTAKAALDAAKDLACARRVYYVDYAKSHLPENLSEKDRDLESSVLAVTAAGIDALDHSSIWEPYHQGYLGRDYFRVEEGSGRCGSRETPITIGGAAPW